jgi:hypothetical protein
MFLAGADLLGVLPPPSSSTSTNSLNLIKDERQGSGFKPGTAMTNAMRALRQLDRAFSPDARAEHEIKPETAA